MQGKRPHVRLDWQLLINSHARNCLLQLVDGLRGNLGADEVDRLEAFDVLEGIESRVGYLGAVECQNLEVLETLEMTWGLMIVSAPKPERSLSGPSAASLT